MFARGSRQRDGGGARAARVVLGRGAEVVQNKRLLGISFQVSESAPRARGDGPLEPTEQLEPADCSPRTRGWSTGVTWRDTTACSAPRARGDGPSSTKSSLRSPGL